MISELKEKLLNLSDEITNSISEAKNINDVEEIRVNSLGKKGSITSHLKNLREYNEVSKREIGALVNEIKNKINHQIKQIRQKFDRNFKKIKSKFFKVYFETNSSNDPRYVFKLSKFPKLSLKLDSVEFIYR